MEKDLKIANEILKSLTSREFHQRGKGRNPPKPGEKAYEIFIEKMVNKIEKNQPIEFILGYGYHKNLNTSSGPEPDEAEKKSLEFLAKLAKKIATIYPAGIVISLITSGERAILANGAKREDTLIYHQQLKEMIKKNADFSKHFRLVQLREIWQQYAEEFYPLLERKLEEVRRNIDLEPNLLEKLKVEAKRNIPPSVANLNEEIVTESVRKFVATFQIERELNIYERFFPGAIRLSYRLDPFGGLRLLIWTTRKGDITQPWRGRYDKNLQKIITQERQKGDLKRLPFFIFYCMLII